MSRLSILALSLVLAALALGAYLKSQAQASQYPILDAVANKVIQRYEQASCEDLWKKRSERTPPGPEEQKFLQILHSDPQMRAEFINKVAAPIANKLFECDLIP
jgi:hypothetical protein